jgi:fumarate hydratase subunit beta
MSDRERTDATNAERAVSLDWRDDAPAAIRERALDELRAGDVVEISGPVLTLRDASAARLAATLMRGERPPVALEGRVMYAVGPSPARPGHVIGSAGPTTTARMARFLPALLSAGVRALIGKGELRGADAAPLIDQRVIYFAAVGGMGALLATHVTSARVVAYDDLGPEALYALDLERFPAVAIIDRAGGNFHELSRAAWRHDLADRGRA